MKPTAGNKSTKEQRVFEKELTTAEFNELSSDEKQAYSFQVAKQRRNYIANLKTNLEVTELEARYNKSLFEREYFDTQFKQLLNQKDEARRSYEQSFQDTLANAQQASAILTPDADSNDAADQGEDDLEDATQGGEVGVPAEATA